MNNEIIIEVTLNGSTVEREYTNATLEDLDQEYFGREVVSMIETLKNADKPL